MDFIDVDPAELTAEIIYQIGALDALARSAGGRVAYLKPHGALYNTIVDHEKQARAVVDALLGTALGLLASAFAQTEFQAVQFMPLLVFPQIILGGLFMPRDQMPDVLYAISDWLPLSYAIDTINAVTAGDEE